MYLILLLVLNYFNFFNFNQKTFYKISLIFIKIPIKRRRGVRGGNSKFPPNIPNNCDNHNDSVLSAPTSPPDLSQHISTSKIVK